MPDSKHSLDILETYENKKWTGAQASSDRRTTLSLVNKFYIKSIRENVSSDVHETERKLKELRLHGL